MISPWNKVLYLALLAAVAAEDAANTAAESETTLTETTNGADAVTAQPLPPPCEGEVLDSVSNGCVSAEVCGTVATAMGLQLGSDLYPFEAEWIDKGCFYFTDDHPLYPNQAYYGIEGTCSQLRIKPSEGGLRMTCNGSTQAPFEPERCAGNLCISPEACEATALAMGLELGNDLYTFAGPWVVKGCVYFPSTHPDFPNQAYFGTGADICGQLRADPNDGSVRINCQPGAETMVVTPPPTPTPEETTPEPVPEETDAPADTTADTGAATDATTPEGAGTTTTTEEADTTTDETTGETVVEDAPVQEEPEVVEEDEEVVVVDDEDELQEQDPDMEEEDLVAEEEGEVEQLVDENAQPGATEQEQTETETETTEVDDADSEVVVDEEEPEVIVDEEPEVVDEEEPEVIVEEEGEEPEVVDVLVSSEAPTTIGGGGDEGTQPEATPDTETVEAPALSPVDAANVADKNDKAQKDDKFQAVDDGDDEDDEDDEDEDEDDKDNKDDKDDKDDGDDEEDGTVTELSVSKFEASQNSAASTTEAETSKYLSSLLGLVVAWLF